MHDAVATSDHVWGRTKVGWHAAFGVFALVGAVLVTVDSAASGTRRIVTLVLLVGLCAWYAGTGARVLHADLPSRLGLVYLAVAGPVTIALFALMQATSILLFALYPQIWSMLPTRWAIWSTATVTVSVGAVLLMNGEFGAAVLMIVIGSAVALVLGLWITKIIEQSRERARLVTELDATRTELAAVSHAAGVLAERERLARDLHDTLAQGSTSVLLLLSAARAAVGNDTAACRRHLDLAEQSTRDNLGELRTLVVAMTPPRLDGVSLPAALRRLTDQLGQELSIQPAMTVSGTHRALPAASEVNLLRVTQETLANVRRHSGATAVTVELGYHDDGVTLRIADDGRGFDPTTQPVGFGLHGLSNRVREAAGELSVQAAPGAGVTVLVRLPTDGAP